MIADWVVTCCCCCEFWAGSRPSSISLRRHFCVKVWLLYGWVYPCCQNKNPSWGEVWSLESLQVIIWSRISEGNAGQSKPILAIQAKAMQQNKFPGDKSMPKYGLLWLQQRLFLKTWTATTPLGRNRTSPTPLFGHCQIEVGFLQKHALSVNYLFVGLVDVGAI